MASSAISPHLVNPKWYLGNLAIQDPLYIRAVLLLTRLIPTTQTISPRLLTSPSFPRSLPLVLATWILASPFDLTPKPPPVNDPVPQLLVRSLDVVVDDDLVVRAGPARVLHLGLGLAQAPPYAVLGLGAAAAQPPLQLGQARRRQEDEARVQVGAFDLLDALGLEWGLVRGRVRRGGRG